MFAGQAIDGTSVSWILTVNVQALVLPEASVAVQVTIVVPFPNVDPDAGAQATATPGQLSAAVAV